ARLSNLPAAKAASLGFLLAAFLHGLYDYLVLLHPVAALPVAAALIVGIWIWRLRLMHRLQQQALKSNELEL
ncbi:MAG: hypothetical protein OEM20_02845, partial [Gammaproteobacteria bacterium]|nr:hypothetical protein [Gammaproteobacteria bacterium]